jgi:hypothetical protein
VVRLCDWTYERAQSRRRVRDSDLHWSVPDPAGYPRIGQSLPDPVRNPVLAWRANVPRGAKGFENAFADLAVRCDRLAEVSNGSGSAGS